MENQYTNMCLPFITIKKLKTKNHYYTIPYTTEGIKPKRMITLSFDEDVEQLEC